MKEPGTRGVPEITRFRRQLADALVDIVRSAGTDVVTIATIYDLVDQRFGPILDRRPRPQRASQQIWQHEVQWELKSALLDGRLTHRPDLGRGIYMLPGADQRRWDAVITIPVNLNADWPALDEVFIPGKVHPHDLQAGSRVWIRQGKRLIHRAVVIALDRRESRVSAIDDRDFGAGWVAEVENWENTDLTDEEIGAAGRWGQARLRYLDPSSLQLRNGTPALHGVRWAGLGTRRTTPVTAQPSGEPVQWRLVEHNLVADWTEWATSAGREIAAPKITTGDGTTLETDAYDRSGHLLIEAKGSSSRMAIRLAIGQILDYSHHLSGEHRRAILVPDRPSSSIVAVAHSLGIGFVYRNGTGFTEELVDRTGRAPTNGDGNAAVAAT